MAYKENNDNVKRKRDAAANKHHYLEQDEGVGIVRHVGLVVPCIKLVQAGLRDPIHGLKKTTITQTQNRTKKCTLKGLSNGLDDLRGCCVVVWCGVLCVLCVCGSTYRSSPERPRENKVKKVQQSQKTPQPDVDRHAEAGDRDHYDDDEFPDLLKDL